MKKLIIVLAVLALGACAKPQTVPQQPIQVPVALVNYERFEPVPVPEFPSTKPIVEIESNDRADKALATTLVYTFELKSYAHTVTDQLLQCNAVITERNARLDKIKQYILLNQAQTQ